MAKERFFIRVLNPVATVSALPIYVARDSTDDDLSVTVYQDYAKPFKTLAAAQAFAASQVGQFQFMKW